MVLTAGQPLNVEGTVQLGPTGTRVLEITGTLPGPGDYPLLQATSLTGTFGSVTGMPVAPAGFSAELVYESTQVVIRVSGPGEAWLAANAAPGAHFGDDPDGNGLTYLQEYAFGWTPGAAADGWITAAVSPNNNLALDFRYNTTAVDVAIEVSGSDDLFTWTPLFSKPAGSTTNWIQHAPGATMERGPVTDGLQTVTISDPASDPKRSFLMLNVSRPE